MNIHIQIIYISNMRIIVNRAMKKKFACYKYANNSSVNVLVTVHSCYSH